MTPAFFRNRPVSSVRLRIVTAILIQFTAVVASGADVEVFDTISSGAHGMAFLAQKIREGQTVRAGFIGGSITQGAGVKKPADSWYAKTRGHLAGFAKTTGAKVETRLAAVGGTGTLYGAIRLGAQLLDKGPLDLLVVEFAVNDFKNPVALDGMEGIVRQALRSNPRMAIVLFYTTNRAMIEECYNKGILPPSVAAFHRVARHYNLAEVHAGPEVRALFRENRITPENFFPDKTHPSAEGHAFYAKHLSDALITALKSADIPLPPLPLPPPAPAAL
ncbi:MAG: SGNH/GDSL hydrolase family protein, partial [Opitutaceae bacterium]|nr:SGNH/GDSL hydrolase family protein [Opitutaceae bacterium]